MDKMKRFGKYVLWIILFWIFSDILIYAGINSTYKDIKVKGDIPTGIEISQIQATTVNGRIRLETDYSLSGKYIKIDLYSANNNILGTQYIEIGNVGENQSKEIETYFKISEVKSCEISIVDQPGETTEGFMDTALSALTVIIIVIKALII